MFRRFAVLVLMCLCLSAITSWGASVHFKPHSVEVNDQGFVVQFVGTLAGLGNGDLLITMSATATAETICRNRGGNEAEGQNPADVTTAGTQIIPASEIQNGQVDIEVITVVPPSPTVEAAGCPNGQWSARFDELHFVSVTIRVEQAGVLVLEETFSL